MKTLKAADLKEADRIIDTSNRKWTVDSTRRGRTDGKIEVFCHNGQSNERFYLKPDDRVTIQENA
jgi:hypothetical protein